jgi:N-acetylglutamate synthase
VPFEIVPLVIDSYDDVLTLWRQCEGVGLSVADCRESIRAYLDRNSGMSFVATAGGKVVGAVLAGHDGRRGLIHHLAVHPNWRRRGIGGELVEDCLRALRGAGIQKCHVLVYRANADAIAFWQSAGWAIRPDIGLLSMTLEPGSGGDC